MPPSSAQAPLQSSANNQDENQGLPGAVTEVNPIIVTVDPSKVDIPGAGERKSVPPTIAGVVDHNGNIIDKAGNIIGIIQQEHHTREYTGDVVTLSSDIVNQLDDKLAQVHTDDSYTSVSKEDMSSGEPQQQQNKGSNVLGKAKSAVQNKHQEEPAEVDSRTRDSSEPMIMQSPQPISDAGEEVGNATENAKNQASNAEGGAQKQGSGAVKNAQSKSSNAGRNKRSKASKATDNARNQAAEQNQASNDAGNVQNATDDADETMNNQQQEVQNAGEEATEGVQDQEMGDNGQDAGQDSDAPSDSQKSTGEKRNATGAEHDVTEGTGESDERTVDTPASEDRERSAPRGADVQDENMTDKAGEAAEGIQSASGEAGDAAKDQADAGKDQAEEGAGQAGETADQGMEDVDDTAEKGADKAGDTTNQAVEGGEEGAEKTTGEAGDVAEEGMEDADKTAEEGAGDADDVAEEKTNDAGKVADEGAEEAGDAADNGMEQAEEADDKLDFSVLKNTQVNKGGKLVNDKGDIMGRLKEGDAKKLLGLVADEKGQIWNKSGKVVGQAEPIPDDEREGMSKDFAPFENFPDAVVEADGRVMCDGRQVGAVVEGDPKRMKGSKVDEDGDILDRRGNTIGKAEAWDEPEEVPEEETDMSSLAGKRVNKAGNIVDANGQLYGRVIEGNIKSLVGRMCDKEGNILSESGEKIGKAELVSEGGREGSKEGPFAELQGCTVAKDGKVVTSTGEVVGRLVSGDPKTLYGRSVDEDGDVVDKNGNTLGKAERWEEPEVEKKKSPLEGRKVNREGDVVDEDGNVIGKLVSGDVASCAGKEVDNDGDVVNAKGDTVGHVSLIEDIPQESAEDKTKREKDDQDRELAGKLAGSIEQSLDKIKPILKMITDKVDKAERTPKEELDEEQLVKEVKPLIEQGGNLLNETNGVIRGMDPDGRIQRNAKHKSSTKDASPEEHHLAEMLKEVSTLRTGRYNLLTRCSLLAMSPRQLTTLSARLRACHMRRRSSVPSGVSLLSHWDKSLRPWACC